jgi:hypothetical protein
VIFMDDAAIDKYISSRIRKNGIGLPELLSPEISPSWSLKLCEILTEGDFDPYDPYRKLTIPLKDIVRYWWDNCIEPELFLGEIFEDIMTIYKDRMLPPEKAEPRTDLSGAIYGILESPDLQR